MSNLPDARVARVIETAVYCDDLSRARDFYTTVLGFETMLDTPRLVALDVGGQSVLLLFQRGLSEDGDQTDGGRVPGHGAQGTQHFAFAITLAAVSSWTARLAAAGVAVESTVHWPRGGKSLYFRDPDGHSVELLTDRSWPIY
ncbi:MAG TPA: VOC family protein [Gemmatimonadaceae bacterium]|nr:VOC family protein [Gemmatimonadaceae bacterium]